MSDEQDNQDTMTTPTHDYRGVQYPLYAFDQPAVVKLPNRTEHHFRLPDETTERRREDLQKTVVLTSPVLIHGESPRDVKTDFTRSQIAYYDMMLEAVSGVELPNSDNGFHPDALLTAKQAVPGLSLPVRNPSPGAPTERPATVLDMIGAPIKRLAISRLYGGRIEVERPEDVDDVDFDIETDPFGDADSIEDAVSEAEQRKTYYALSLNRTITLRQELGIEQIKGVFTNASNVILYTFAEPDGNHFSKWELKAYKGFAVSRPKGGERIERHYNLDTMRVLFDSLIESIQGASLDGKPINLPSDRENEFRKAQLARIPLAVKKTMVALLFNEVSNLGNS